MQSWQWLSQISGSPRNYTNYSWQCRRYPPETQTERGSLRSISSFVRWDPLFSYVLFGPGSRGKQDTEPVSINLQSVFSSWRLPSTVLKRSLPWQAPWSVWGRSIQPGPCHDSWALRSIHLEFHVRVAKIQGVTSGIPNGTNQWMRSNFLDREPGSKLAAKTLFMDDLMHCIPFMTGLLQRSHLAHRQAVHYFSSKLNQQIMQWLCFKTLQYLRLVETRFFPQTHRPWPVRARRTMSVAWQCDRREPPRKSWTTVLPSWQATSLAICWWP